MSDARLAGGLFAGAFLIRLIAGMGATLFGTDGGHFLLMADWISQGRFDEALRIAYHPCYPLLIALAKMMPGDTISAGHAVSIVLGSAAVLPLFGLIRRTFGQPAAFLGGLLFAFHPLLVEVHSDVLTEGAFHFFLFAAMDLTGRMSDEPVLERATVLGCCAAAAYLVRPEGLLAIALAVGWPAIALVTRRDRIGLRLLGIALTVGAIALLVSPYLFWIHSVRGSFSLSMRPSMDSARRAVTVLEEAGAGEGRSAAYGSFFKGLYRFTYLVMIPFYVIGLKALGRIKIGALLFYFSLPACYLAALLLTLRVHSFMSWRYLTAPMSMLLVIPALGLLEVFRESARRWPGRTWQAPACGAVLLLFGVLPGFRTLEVSRTELVNCEAAARWIRERGGPMRCISGPIQQVAYLAGRPSCYSALTAAGLRDQIRNDPVDCFVYSGGDVLKRASYVEMLRSCDLLEPPVEILGPRGSVPLYIQRVKR